MDAVFEFLAQKEAEIWTSLLHRFIKYDGSSGSEEDRGDLETEILQICTHLTRPGRIIPIFPPIILSFDSPKIPIIPIIYSRIILNILSSFAYKHMQEDRNTVTVFYIGAQAKPPHTCSQTENCPVFLKNSYMYLEEKIPALMQRMKDGEVGLFEQL